jgi:hypothetical protein
MAITPEKLKDLQRQLANIQTGFNTLTKTETFKVDPTYKSPSTPTVPEFGASGRGEFPEQLAAGEEPMSLGVPTSEIGDYTSDPNYVIPNSGFNAPYAGRSAKDISDQEKKDAMSRAQSGQVSSLNSFAFNPETTSGVKKASENFQLALNEITGGMPFSSSGSKNVALKSTLAGAADAFAKNFKSADEFVAAYQGNQDIQKGLESFLKAGGSLSDITSKIKAPAPMPVQDGQTGQMNTAEYLSSLTGSNQNDPATQAAEKALFPETLLAQDEIARQYNIPNEIKRLYFGDERTIGVLQQRKSIAEEKVRIIKTKVEDSETTAREMADYEVQKNDAEVEIAANTIEENRLNAKNYMTASLARLGALKTTGAAPLAIATLDQKYQNKKSELYTKLRFANDKIRIDMRSKINDVETKADELILSIKEDLSKDEETAMKEIMKAQETAQKEIYNITSKYATKFTDERQKYEKDAKTSSEKYIKDFYTLASKGYNPSQIASILKGTASADTIYNGQKTRPKAGAGNDGITNDKGQYVSAKTMPIDLRDSIAEKIVLQRATLPQIYTAYPQVSRVVLNGLYARYNVESERNAIPGLGDNKKKTTTSSKGSREQ